MTTELAFPTGPAGTLATRDQLDRFTADWLANRRLSDHTRVAYRGDVADYLTWCEAHGLSPLAVRFTHVNTYARELETTLGRTGRPTSVATVARKLSSVSSWYSFLVKLGALAVNPVTAVDRPKVDQDSSPTIGLTGPQCGALVRAARDAAGSAALRNTALLGALAQLGLRVSEALELDLADIRYNRDHRTVRAHGKGGKVRELPVPPPLSRDLNAYLASRAAAAGVPVDDLTGLVFVTAAGKPLDQAAVFRLVRRTARAAGLAEADRLSPHSLRHSAITAAYDAGCRDRDVQDFAGHADPRTTRRYDRGRGSLDRSPAYKIAHFFAVDDQDVA